MSVGTSSRKYERLEHARDVYRDAEIAGFKQRGLWLDRLLVDLLDEHARTHPDDTAVVDERRRVSWRALRLRVDRIAAGFVTAGLVPGDFVALQIPNWVEFVESYLAVQRAGLRALTIMMIYRERDVAYMLRKCRARMLVTPEEHRGFDHVAMAQRLRSSVETLERVVVIGEPGDGMLPYEGFMASVDPPLGAFAGRRPDPDGLSKVSFTSGTTDLPKGVVHTHNTDMVPPLLTARAIGLDRTTPIWMPSPIAHATGLLFGVYDSLLTGAKLVLQDVWDPVAALELISRERAAFTVSATPFIGGMLEQPDLDRYDLRSFRYFLSGGARIPPALVERARDRMGTLLLRVFGQSEAPLHTLNFPDDPWEKVVSRDGRPLEGVKVRIVDPLDRTRELSPGEVGEYSTWGPHVFLGYLGDVDRTMEAKDLDGWYYSSDLCLVDDEDYVLYVDRIKDIINRGGVKISALEVENLLAAHPAVQSAAVVAMLDERLGERACAFVVPRPGTTITLAELARFLTAEGVTKQKWPERLEVVESLPTTATGKIQKNVLRARLASPASGPTLP